MPVEAPLDLEETINSSIEDATLPQEEPEEAPQGDTSTESEITVPEASSPVLEASQEVPSPAKSEAEAKATDDFEKRFGIPAQSTSGRENRIPYSRVKKITEKAVNDARKEWDPKYTELETKAKGYEGRLTELDTKVKDYEGRLGQVAEFERVMTQDPTRFLQMLNQLPQYAQIFQSLMQGGQAVAQPGPAVSDDMPQPDQKLSDGSTVYSMDGLKALMAWQGEQVRQKTLNDIAQRYAPLENDYVRYQQTQAVLPQIQQQINEARTWPLFNESENEIVTALQQNPQFTLERAYQSVVWPKFQAEREKLANDAKVSKESIRAEVLKELKQAPKSTAVQGSITRSPSATGGAPRSLEAVIEEAIKDLK